MKAIQFAFACGLLLPNVAAMAQVTASTTLSAAGHATVRVGNPTADTIFVVIELFHDATLPDGPVALGILVEGLLISPYRFRLGPGELQVVRIRVDLNGVRSGEVLRLVTTLTPDPPQRAGNAEGIVLGLVLQRRLITKLIVQ